MELKQDRMSRQERLQALYNYEKPDRVPIMECGSTFCMVNAGYKVADLYSHPRKAFNALMWTCEQYGWEPEPHLTSAHAVLGSWGFGARVQVPDSAYSQGLKVVETAVKTEDDVWNLKMPNPRTSPPVPMRMEFSKLEARAGLPINFLTRSPFCTAADICGVEQFCRWMHKKPELCHKLINMGMKYSLEVLQYWVDTFGAEKIFCLVSSPTESNQVISPTSLQKYAIPYHKEFHRRLRAMGVNKFLFHICGDQNLNLRYLAELAASSDGWPHPSILSFGHEVDISDAAQYFPKDIILGNIEPALFQHGTPHQIYEVCRETIKKGKKIPGGFILAPGCAMPPWAPPYNVYQMTKAVNDFGWYD